MHNVSSTHTTSLIAKQFHFRSIKAPRYFFPSQINEIKPIIDDIDSLNVFPFLDGIDLEELPASLAAAEVEDL